jgi:glycosyltransferase involved in cell wall biosynthesis
LNIEDPDMPTLAACLITHNNDRTIEACLGSVSGHVDEIILVDTRSTDDTRQRASKFGAQIFDFDHHTHPRCFLQDTEELSRRFGIDGEYTDEFFLSDYAEARNHGFDNAKSDYLMWLDTDDVMVGAENLARVLSQMETRNLAHISANYDYSFDLLGNPTSHFPRARIVKNSPAIRWAGAAHEVLVCPGNSEYTNLINIQHKHWKEAEAARTIKHKAYKILCHQHSLLDDKLSNPRLLFYLGQESRSLDPRKSMSHYLDYLKVATWDQERAWARTALGQAHEASRDYSRAFECYAAVSADVADNPDGHFGMARIAYHQGDWAKCISHSEAGFKIDHPAPTLCGLDRRGDPHVYYNVALGNVGRIREALDSCNKGLAVLPENEFLLQNKLHYEERLRASSSPDPGRP